MDGRAPNNDRSSHGARVPLVNLSARCLHPRCWTAPGPYADRASKSTGPYQDIGPRDNFLAKTNVLFSLQNGKGGRRANLANANKKNKKPNTNEASTKQITALETAGGKKLERMIACKTQKKKKKKKKKTLTDNNGRDGKNPPATTQNEKKKKEKTQALNHLTIKMQKHLGGQRRSVIFNHQKIKKSHKRARMRWAAERSSSSTWGIIEKKKNRNGLKKTPKIRPQKNKNRPPKEREHDLTVTPIKHQ